MTLTLEAIQEKYNLGDAQRFGEECYELRHELEMLAGRFEDPETWLSQEPNERGDHETPPIQDESFEWMILSMWDELDGLNVLFESMEQKSDEK